MSTPNYFLEVIPLENAHEIPEAVSKAVFQTFETLHLLSVPVANGGAEADAFMAKLKLVSNVSEGLYQSCFLTKISLGFGV